MVACLSGNSNEFHHSCVIWFGFLTNNPVIGINCYSVPPPTDVLPIPYEIWNATRESSPEIVVYVVLVAVVIVVEYDHWEWHVPICPASGHTL